MDRFLAAVGPERTVEETVVITRLDRAPETRDDTPFVPASRPPFKSRPSSAPRKPYRKFEHAPVEVMEPAAQTEPERDGDTSDKPWRKKKPFKKAKPGFKFGPKADGKPAKGKRKTKAKFTGGDAPLKRKKPRKKFD